MIRARGARGAQAVKVFEIPRSFCCISFTFTVYYRVMQQHGFIGRALTSNLIASQTLMLVFYNGRNLQVQ